MRSLGLDSVYCSSDCSFTIPSIRRGCPCRGLCKSKITERKKRKKKDLRTKIDNPLKRTTQNRPARALPVCRLLLRPVLTRPLIDAVGKSPSRAAPPQGMKHARIPCVQEFIVEEQRCRVMSGRKRAWTAPRNACTTRWETGRRQQHEQNDEYLRRSWATRLNLQPRSECSDVRKAPEFNHHGRTAQIWSLVCEV